MYVSLKEEFERRRDQLRQTGVIPDARDAQIERLKQQVGQLKERLSSLAQANADLTSLRTQALSRLAAQRDEITRLRAVVAGGTNVLALRQPGIEPSDSRNRESGGDR